MHDLFRICRTLKDQKWSFVLAYIGVAGVAVFSMVVPRLLGTTIDLVMTSKDLNGLLLLSGAILLLSGLRGLSIFTQVHLSERISLKVAYKLRTQFLLHLEKLSFRYHDSQKTGDLMSRGTYDIEVVRVFISSVLIKLPQNLLLIFGAVIMIVITDFRLGIISIAVIPPATILTILVSSRLRAFWEIIQADTGHLTTVLQENLSGIRVVKAYGAEKHELNKFEVISKKIRHETYLAAALMHSRQSIMQFAFAIVTVVIMWLGGMQIINGSLTAGELTQFLLYLGMLVMPIRMLGMMVNAFARAVPSSTRLYTILDAQSPVEDAKDAIQLKDVRGHVQFKNVSFGYKPRTSTLHSINIDALPGQTIGIIGPPGSGKSTLMQLIPRFYDVTSGSITIDGCDVRSMTQSSLHKNIGIVFQDIFLFSATIKDNLTYGSIDSTDDEIIAAAKCAEIHDFIESLPAGYGSWVGERGVSLSRGQRQRLSIARTLLMDPPVIILDDSMSAVDTQTEANMKRVLVEQLKKRTTFVIAHRVNSIKDADHILVINNGSVEEEGSHDELIRKHGLYRELYQLQSAAN